jgi:hypothetical protein
MVSEYDAYFLRTIEIPCEQDNINFEAREIGFYGSLYEKEKDDKQREWFLYFIEYSEGRLEIANAKLKEFRAKLDDYNKQQRQLQPV